MRENVDTKGRRLLAEGRLTVVCVDGKKIIAECKGDSAEIYHLGWDPNEREWRCTCIARGKCSHLVALQLITRRPE